MNTHRALLVVLVVNGLAALACSGTSERRVQEDVDILSSTTSPNMNYVATVYSVSGGGAAGYVYNVVNIRGRHEPFDKAKGIVLSTSSKSLTPAVLWADNEHLTIKLTKSAPLYYQSKEWGRIREFALHISRSETHPWGALQSEDSMVCSAPVRSA